MEIYKANDFKGMSQAEVVDFVTSRTRKWYDMIQPKPVDEIKKMNPVEKMLIDKISKLKYSNNMQLNILDRLSLTEVMASSLGLNVKRMQNLVNNLNMSGMFQGHVIPYHAATVIVLMQNPNSHSYPINVPIYIYKDSHKNFGSLESGYESNVGYRAYHDRDLPGGFRYIIAEAGNYLPDYTMRAKKSKVSYMDLRMLFREPTDIEIQSTMEMVIRATSQMG